MVVILSWIFGAGCFYLTYHRIRHQGFMAGGRPIWVYALLLVPTWFVSRFSAMTIDTRTMTALAILIGFMMQPVGDRARPRWYFSDFALALVCAGIVLTQSIRDSAEPMMLLDRIVSLLLPYIVGRLFLRTTRDIETILPAFCTAVVILGVYALIEGITRKNPIEIFLGRPWLEEVLVSYDEVRFGLKRAYGPQTHAIYFGLTFAMVMPWAIEGAVRAWNRTGPKWWYLAPAMAIAGIITTGSRAAQIAVLTVLIATFFQAFRKWRGPVLVLCLLGAVGFEMARDDIIDWLSHYVSESKEGVEYIKINGVEYEYNGTKHRDLLFLVYEEAIQENDWLGYGMALKGMQPLLDPNMEPRFKSIDNHYLLWFLQYGYLGIVLFAVLAVSFLCNLLSPLIYGSGPSGRLAGGLFGAMVGAVIAMRGVWLAADFATVWLFFGGMSTCLSRLREAPEGDTAIG